MTEREEEDLRAQMSSVRTRLNAMDGHISDMRAKLDHLVIAEAERRGREKESARETSYSHDDRWQVWVRAFLPISLLTGIFTAVWTWIVQVYNGGGQ